MDAGCFNKGHFSWGGIDWKYYKQFFLGATWTKHNVGSAAIGTHWEVEWTVAMGKETGPTSLLRRTLSRDHNCPLHESAWAAVAQFGWLKWHTFISHSSGSWEVQDEGASRFRVQGEPLFLLPWAAFSVYFQMVKAVGILVFPLLIRALTPSWGVHDLI